MIYKNDETDNDIMPVYANDNTSNITVDNNSADPADLSRRPIMVIDDVMTKRRYNNDN